MEAKEPTIFRTRLDASGRIVIPAETRARRNLKEGAAVVVVEDERGLHVKSLDEALADAQKYFCEAIPPEVSLSDELLAERCEEAARE